MMNDSAEFMSADPPARDSDAVARWVDEGGTTVERMHPDGSPKGHPDMMAPGVVKRRGKIIEKEATVIFLPEDVNPQEAMRLMGGLWSEQKPSSWPSFREFVRTPELAATPPDTAAVLKTVRGRTPRRVEIVECENGYVLMLSRGDNTEYQIHVTAEEATVYAEEFLDAR